ncbi:hypothetical protein VVD49_06555 [Uliginosibacterium sp. H3]|uniref:Uncharacterized protein n=1 Tax=Uliginosibacterium silvisoli TaxID=3114758 RepID=A0ABU6K133_9RHOO|nr:hypothetical protein [Uliginosibacterium sp. H3]
MWKKLRIAILLFILATVALGTWRSQSVARDWRSTLHIAIFPINGDGSAAAAARIASLNETSFKGIEDFLAGQALEYGNQTLMPVRVSLQPELKTLPPAAPGAGHSMLDVMVWSLKLRWWAWRQPSGSPRAHTRAFVIYWDSEKTDGRIPNSHGLSKGLIAISNVHAVANMQRTNSVVIAHEILHTLGATDKYDPASLMPLYPDGYAEPGRQPRFPQRLCEIMAGRIPLSDGVLTMPGSLNDCLIGPRTAQEIGLTR